MSEPIPPTKKALSEAFELSQEILKDIELSQIPLSNIALKACRLARLLNDFQMQKILEYEVSGYPTTPNGVSPDIFKLATKASRKFSDTVITPTFSYAQKKEIKEYVYLESIDALEKEVLNTEKYIDAAREPMNPVTPIRKKIMNTEIESPSQTSVERKVIRDTARKFTNRLASRKNFIYQYALSKHYELKFSGIADDIFSRIRERADSTIGKTIPDSIKRFTAIYENLISDNPEDWSNAVHGCRRVLIDMADFVFPPSDETREIKNGNKTTKIKLGKENYVNRIIAFVEDNASSGSYKNITGSHIRFLGDRLDSIVDAANKGSHDTIISREEADRYVVYTYLLIGDVLSLLN